MNAVMGEESRTGYVMQLECNCFKSEVEYSFSKTASVSERSVLFIRRQFAMDYYDYYYFCFVLFFVYQFMSSIHHASELSANHNL